MVPLLEPAVSSTCVSDDPLGPVVQGWYGLLGDRELHVEVIYPAGRVLQGRQVAEPLLRGLSREEA